ncbi:MAG: DUF6282 family protein, partial [Actinomycetota bacterium]
NPAAVEAALQLGGREVWMPTVDAAFHVEMHGGTGAYDVQKSVTASTDAPKAVHPGGISAIDEEGNLRPETLEVLDLIAQHDAILGTCHLSPGEIRTLIHEARSRGVQRIVITHPFFKVPNLSLDELRELAAEGTYAEFGYCTVSPMWHYADPQRVAEAVRAVGPKHCLLVSDTGQRHNPMPAEALRIFAQSLFESGLSEEDIDQLIRLSPAELLDLPPSPPTKIDPATEGAADD